jgi:prephenate dehydratase
MPTVAYQGVPGANSEAATFGYFGPDATPLPCESFAVLFAAVLDGAASYGVVPIENSLAGSVIDNYDLLAQRDVTIVGELFLHIRYQLLAPPGVRLDGVRRVYSHPQALAQSHDFFTAHPALTPVADFDTAGAARAVAARGRSDEAAIAPPQAGVRYGLVSLAEDIQSHAENYTRMVIIGRETYAPTAGAETVWKTSVLAGVRHETGSLATLLDVLRDARVNLTKIESRPVVGEPWAYRFFLDWEGLMSQEHLAAARAVTTLWKQLGTYPRGQIIGAP